MNVNAHLVNQWINSDQDYNKGLDILELAQSQGIQTKLRIVKSAKNSVTQKILKSEIVRLKDWCTNKADEKPKKHFGSISESKLPEDLRELQRQTVSHLKEMDQIKGQLRSIYYDSVGGARRMPDKTVGSKLVKRLHELFLLNGEYFARLDYYHEHGKYLPGTEPELHTIPRLVFLLKNQIRMYEYLNKVRRKIAKGQVGFQITTYNEYLLMEAEIKKIVDHE